MRVGASNATLGGNPMVGFLRVHAEEEVNSNADRPYVEQEATVVCLTTQTEYSYEVTELPSYVLEDVELRKTSYVMPWAIYTIPLSSIRDDLPSGTLTPDGIELVADVIDEMVRL